MKIKKFPHSALLIAIAFSFNTSAQIDPVTHASPVDPLHEIFEDSVRAFDGLCVYEDRGSESEIFARFLPNEADYFTKLTPSRPITRGEHIRDLLILPYADVNGFIEMVNRANTGDPHLRAQRQEMKKAREAFLTYRLKMTHGIEPDLPSCSDPFPEL